MHRRTLRRHGGGMNLRTSVIARLLVMALILIGLLIPLTMVQSVVSERAARRDSVAEEMSGTWGGAQTIAGPVLIVPYRCSITDNDGRTRQIPGRATFLPEALDVQGVLEPELRKRTLFKVVVYKAHLKISGRFSRPDLSSVTRTTVEPLWSEAVVSIGISDPRGIARRAALKWNGVDIPLEPGAIDTGLFPSGLHVPVDLTSALAGSSIPFALDLDVNGNRDLRILPVGSETSTQLTSSWPHPSFVGGPDPRTVNADGFTAVWRVPYFGRGFSRVWTDAGLDRDKMKRQADASAFGVSLVQPVDIYQQAERAVKYASLFIVMTFVVFFLFEVVRARLLHPVQYVFIGFAMCIFYLLLVSISEHVGFDAAYAGAATVTILLIASYSVFVLGGFWEGTLIGTALGAVYGFLYLLLRLEDYALLAGSIGLFAMLALVMLLTRRVNWYELKLGTAAGD
jgi:inner membrane protein